jgi:hypothetical protein
MYTHKSGTGAYYSCPAPANCTMTQYLLLEKLGRGYKQYHAVHLYYLIIAKLWKFTFKAILWCGFCMISSAENTVASSYFFSVVCGPHVPNSDALTVVTSGTGVNATAHACMLWVITSLSHKRQTTCNSVGIAAY